MPRVSGVFSLVPSYKATSGQSIRTEQHNPPLEDIADALTKSLPRDGSAPMTGPLSMGERNITNLGPATLAGHAVRRDQVTLFSAYLNAVRNLTLEANKLPYATSATTAAATTLTAFGRSLLDDVDAATARATLEIVELAIATQDEAEEGTDNLAYMTPLRVAQAMATQPLANYYEESFAVPAAETIQSGSHGLGARPTLFSVSIRCATPDLGYNLADEVVLVSHEGNGSRGFGAWSSPGGMGCMYSDNIFIKSRAAAGMAAITPANWTLVFRAWR